MGTDRLRYSITDVFRTFPFVRPTELAQSLGKELHGTQMRIAEEYELGLTEIYNKVNSMDSLESWVRELRDIHEKIDRYFVDLYGFNLNLGTYEVAEFEKTLQWGPPASQRIEILQLLLAENQRQQVEGVIEWPTK
jgi:hypothetical protein